MHAKFYIKNPPWVFFLLHVTATWHIKVPGLVLGVLPLFYSRHQWTIFRLWTSNNVLSTKDVLFTGCNN